MKKKVLVAISGGVDSAVTMALLQEQGYEVVGVTMIADSEEPAKEGAALSAAMGWEHHIVDVRKEFKTCVQDYFLHQYERGLTPNPCIACNKYIKFGLLFDYMKKVGADYFATGHYARVTFSDDYNRYVLRKAVYQPKDQSYVLFNLSQQVLSHLLLPLGNYKKEDIREMARNMGIPVAEKKESQDICFIPDGDYRGYLARAGLRAQPGDFVTPEGLVIGKHKGISSYTIGQRRGLGLALGYPAFVVDINAEKNQVVVGAEGYLYQKDCMVDEVNWIAIPELTEPMQVEVKIRYKSAPAKAVIEPEDQQVRVVFDTPQAGITPGQGGVFYQGDTVIGGGIITKKSSIN
ncbi:MAG: tRNA 2-thiouridine(34) synthase MnmA [Peptococcaceae bacterium]|nr:tRNA 2-thiouridine(34) synthase MnmA [Peptococcaceae bacterium]